MQTIGICCPSSYISASAQTDALQCVCDPVTRIILQCNCKIKTAEGQKSPVGSACWEVFAPGAPGPCPHCPVGALLDSPDMPIAQEQEDPLTSRIYRRTDSLIPAEEGHFLHFLYMLDVTDLHDTQRRLSHDMVLIDLLTNLSINFASSGSFDEKINRALSTTGRFMGADRAYILQNRAEQCLYIRSNIWLNPEVPENDNISAGKFDYIVASNPDSGDYLNLSNQVPVCFADVDNLPVSMRQRWSSTDIRALMAIPLHAEGLFWGVLSFDMSTKPRPWSDSDLRLGQAVGGIISTAIERDGIETHLFSLQGTHRRILDAVPDMIFWQDAEHVIRGCNQAYADYVLLPSEEIIGKTVFDLYQEEMAQKIRDEDARALETQTPIVKDGQMFRGRDGRGNWISIRKFPLRDSSGASILLGVLRDITAQKNAELEFARRDEDLQAAMRAAETSSRAKTEFLSRMSHEIRTPMNAILGMTRLAGEALDNPSPAASERARGCLQKIEHASRQLLDVMKDILIMSRLSSEGMDVHPRAFELEKLLMRVSSVVAERAAEKQQDFCVVMEEDVPPVFLGDEDHIDRVLYNLLFNACKFTPDGGLLILNVSLLSRSDRTANILFSVEDTGIGIAEEKQKDLFDSFEQIDGGMARVHGGTGLGLAIGKRLVALMGGEIGLESALGQGSRFYFNLPLEIIHTVAPLSSPILTPDGLPPSLLIVDDCADICRQFESLAQRLGCRAESATDCGAALRAIQSALVGAAPFDLVFVDVSMPRADGLDVAARIRERFEHQPIVMMGSAGQRGSYEQRAGVSDFFLIKPFFLSLLADCLRDALKARPASRPGPAVHRDAEFAGKTILLADDVDINRDMMTGMLEHTCVTVIPAEDGLSAVEAFQAEPERFDMILMDVYMPKMDGLEAARRIRALDTPRAASIPILAVSASSLPEDREKSLASGMNDHIAKPVDDFTLLDMLRRYLLPEHNAPVHAPPPAAVPRRSDADYLPHINIEAGLRGARGNRKLYVSMLNNLHGGTLYRDFSQAFKDGELAEAQTLALKLEGVAAGLALDSLMHIAGHMTKALRRSRGMADAYAALDAAYQDTLNAIDDFLKEENTL